MIIETPDWDLASVGLSGVSNEFCTTASTVYEPAEDTFLMLDSLQQDLEHIIQSRLLYQKADASVSTCEPLLVVELGSGLGLLSAAVAKAIRDCDVLASIGAHCVAVDVNPAACCATAYTCKLNGVMVDVVRGDLLEWMQRPESTSIINENTNHDIYGPIDLLLFNPPYVRGPIGESAPASTMFNIDSEDKTAFLTLMTNAAWLGGGPDGVDVLKRALHQAADLLSERGVFYVLMIDYNFSALVCEEIKTRHERDSHVPTSEQVYQESINHTNFMMFTTFGKNPISTPLACRRLLSRNVPGERLSVYRVYRPHFLELETNNS